MERNRFTTLAQETITVESGPKERKKATRSRLSASDLAVLNHARGFKSRRPDTCQGSLNMSSKIETRQTQGSMLGDIDLSDLLVEVNHVQKEHLGGKDKGGLIDGFNDLINSSDAKLPDKSTVGDLQVVSINEIPSGRRKFRTLHGCCTFDCMLICSDPSRVDLCLSLIDQCDDAMVMVDLEGNPIGNEPVPIEGLPAHLVPMEPPVE